MKSGIVYHGHQDREIPKQANKQTNKQMSAIHWTTFVLHHRLLEYRYKRILSRKPFLCQKLQVGRCLYKESNETDQISTYGQYVRFKAPWLVSIETSCGRYVN